MQNHGQDFLGNEISGVFIFALTCRSPVGRPSLPPERRIAGPRPRSPPTGRHARAPSRRRRLSPLLPHTSPSSPLERRRSHLSPCTDPLHCQRWQFYAPDLQERRGWRSCWISEGRVSDRRRRPVRAAGPGLRRSAAALGPLSTEPRPTPSTTSEPKYQYGTCETTNVPRGKHTPMLVCGLPLPEKMRGNIPWLWVSWMRESVYSDFIKADIKVFDLAGRRRCRREAAQPGGWGRAIVVLLVHLRIRNIGGELLELSSPVAQSGCWGRAVGDAGAASDAAGRLGRHGAGCAEPGGALSLLPGRCSAAVGWWRTVDELLGGGRHAGELPVIDSGELCGGDRLPASWVGVGCCQPRSGRATREIQATRTIHARDAGMELLVRGWATQEDSDSLQGHFCTSTHILVLSEKL